MSVNEPSHPRPDFSRARWQSLDGFWQFARGPQPSPIPAGRASFDEKVLVPFPWESELSGVGAHWLEQGRYRRHIEIPPGWAGDRVVVHFGGVHHHATCYVNGSPAGTHIGTGPFELDITDYLDERAGDLTVAVEAPIDKQMTAHGKQRSIPADDYDSCAFQPSSGIWQPVWLEARPVTFLRALRVESFPSLDGFLVRATVEGPAKQHVVVTVELEGADQALTLTVDQEGRAEGRLALENPRQWSPESPHLYFFNVSVTSSDGRDEVGSYGGLRAIEVQGHELHLNGRRLYLRGVLDQGYWPTSGLSAPGPEALRRDLQLARDAGYNMVRKHLKLEDPRWLYEADRMGMLVWEEPPSTSRFSGTSVAAFSQGVQAMVARDANHPSVILWGLYNEEWGLDWKVAEDEARQEVLRQATALLRSLDTTRPVIDNSGWCHVSTDVVDWHYYEADLGKWAKNVGPLVNDLSAQVPVPLHPPAIEMKPLAVDPVHLRGRPNINGEYGMGQTSVERAWHLKWQTQELRRHDALSGYVYTELCDIEHEFAGLYTFDRGSKDLANIQPAQVNAETVFVVELVPLQPGVDLKVSKRDLSFEARLSHHGPDALTGRVLAQWGPHLGASASGPKVYDELDGPVLSVGPFVLSPTVPVHASLPPGLSSARLHLSFVVAGRAVAATSVDVVLAGERA